MWKNINKYLHVSQVVSYDLIMTVVTKDGTCLSIVPSIHSLDMFINRPSLNMAINSSDISINS